MLVDLNPYVVLGSAVVGLLVGLTGAGGGALMTPMLIGIFGVSPVAAISSDLVASMLMRPAGSLVHLRKGTVNMRLAGWLCLGSMPMAFLGTYLLHLLGGGQAQRRHVELALGVALLAGTAALLLRAWLDRRGGRERTQAIGRIRVRPLVTLAIGAAGGLIVGFTSVGAGSLMIVALLFSYPTLAAGQLVGTDLTQAVPLTQAAALGALVFGHVQFGLTTAVIIGSVPAVLVGALLSARVPDRFIRPVITYVIFASGLKYTGLGTAVLGWLLCLAAAGCGGYWLARNKPWQTRQAGHGMAEPGLAADILEG